MRSQRTGSGLCDGFLYLCIDQSDNTNLKLSARNLQGRMVLPPEGINLYDLLRHDHIVVTKDAVSAIEARFGA